MDVSLIIPTYNGSKKIQSCLDSIQHQTILPKEIIVVVDGSTDDTVDLLRNYRSKVTMRVIEQSNQGRAATRNNGAKLAKGDLLIFIDDDILLDQCVIEKHVAAQRNPAVYSGKIKISSKQISSDFQLYRGYLSEKWLNKLPRGRVMTSKELFLTAANFSIPKIFFDALEGFDQRLTDAEDYDLAFRAYQLGYRIQYLPEAIGWHDDRSNFRGYLKRLREYREGHQQLLQINAQIKEGIDVPYNRNNSHGARRLFFRVFLNERWIRMVDDDKLTLLPQWMRFRVYDWISTAYSSYFPDYPIAK